MDRPHPRLAGIAAGGALGFSAWWTAGFRPFTWPALLAVGVAGLGTIAIGTFRRRPIERRALNANGVLVWAIVCGLLVAWELVAYFQHPRADHPTLSALAEPVIDWRPTRAVAFIMWIALGANLARR